MKSKRRIHSLFLINGLLMVLSLSSSAGLCSRTQLSDPVGVSERSAFQAASAKSRNHALSTSRNPEGGSQFSKQNRIKYPTPHTAVVSWHFGAFKPTERLSLVDGDASPAYSSVCFTRFQGRAPPLSA